MAYDPTISVIEDLSTSSPNSSGVLSPNKFKMVINRFPTTNFFVQSAIIPAITLGSAMQYTNSYADIKIPGDKVEFEDLIVTILIDQNILGYQQIFEWLSDAAKEELDFPYSDISIIALTGNSNYNKKFKFMNCFPYTLSNIVFDTRVAEDEPLTADIIFKYTDFIIE